MNYSKAWTFTKALIKNEDAAKFFGQEAMKGIKARGEKSIFSAVKDAANNNFDDITKKGFEVSKLGFKNTFGFSGAAKAARDEFRRKGMEGTVKEVAEVGLLKKCGGLLMKAPVLMGLFEIPSLVTAWQNGDFGKQVGRSGLIVAGNLGGASAGASVGAAIGSCFFPGVGTVVGGFVGSLVGAFAGGSAAKAVGDGVFDKSIEEQKAEITAQEGEQSMADGAYNVVKPGIPNAGYQALKVLPAEYRFPVGAAVNSARGAYSGFQNTGLSPDIEEVLNQSNAKTWELMSGNCDNSYVG